MNTYTIAMTMTTEDRYAVAKMLNNAKTALWHIRPLITNESSILDYGIAEQMLADISNYLTSRDEISGYGIVILNTSINAAKGYLNRISDYLFEINDKHAEKFMLEIGTVHTVPMYRGC